VPYLLAANASVVAVNSLASAGGGLMLRASDLLQFHIEWEICDGFGDVAVLLAASLQMRCVAGSVDACSLAGPFL